MIDAYHAKQALSEMVDKVAELAIDRDCIDKPPTHPANIYIPLPPQLASQVFLTGNADRVYCDDHVELIANADYTVSGDVITVTREFTRLTIMTGEALWKWDCVSQRWWVAGIDPEFYYKLRNGAETCDQ